MKTNQNHPLHEVIAQKKQILHEKYGLLEGAITSKLPPELELQWLEDMLAFEEQWATANMITVAERLGFPSFPAADQLDDQQLALEWVRLKYLMAENGLELCAIHPRPDRELYRFTVEELFEAVTDDIRMPEMTTFFVYEDFHSNEENA